MHARILRAARPGANAIMRPVLLLPLLFLLVLVIVIDLFEVEFDHEQEHDYEEAGNRNQLSFRGGQLIFRPATARWRRDDLPTWSRNLGPYQRMRSRRS
jgi:hypothetical protein